MKPEDVRSLYDAAYARTYEEKFLDAELVAPDTQYEIDLIRSLLVPGASWLDVACGTGYFLRRFPEHDRAGLDLSPGMLGQARAANPGLDLREHDYRLPIPEWNDRFGLVSCMWYAYCYVDTMSELDALIDNLAAWTAPTGRCFVPLADPDLLTRRDIDYHPAMGQPGELTITAILWSFTEENGAKDHRHLLAPKIEYMVERFERHFDRVEVVRYPLVTPGVGRRPALIASGKRGA